MNKYNFKVGDFITWPNSKSKGNLYEILDNDMVKWHFDSEYFNIRKGYVSTFTLNQINNNAKLIILVNNPNKINYYEIY